MKLLPWLRLITMLLALILFPKPRASARTAQSSDTPEDMQALLAETGRNYRGARSLRIERETVGSVKSELEKVWDKSFSSVVIAPGNRYRREEKYAREWDIRQSDGTTEWVWHPWRKQYSEQQVQRSSELEASSPAGDGWIGWLKQIDKKLASGRVQPPETIEVRGRRVNCLVVIGPPSPRPMHNPTMSGQTTYWIDRDRKILVKEQAVVHSTLPDHEFESVFTTTYNVVELNPSLPDSLFKFVPERGVQRVEEFESGPITLAGKAAPSLKLKALDGKDFDLASLRGKAVIVDFWATWCMPCRESMPHLAKLNDEFHTKGLEIVSVSKDEDPADVVRFVAKHKYLWTHLVDPSWETNKNWGESGIPRLVLVGRDGTVLFESDGYDDSEEAKLRLALHKMDPVFPADDGSSK